MERFLHHVLSPGVEPGALVPQTSILSIKLRERVGTAYLKIPKIPVSDEIEALRDLLREDGEK